MNTTLQRSVACALCLFVCLFTCAPVVPPSAAQGARRKPNVIFILADDLGYGDIGPYGQRRIRTPHLDRLAREGVRFTDFYAASPVCAPSRASLMTGQHQGHTYIRGNSTKVPVPGQSGAAARRLPLRPRDVTVAEVLKGAGYATGVVGKWGLGEPGTTGVPNSQGFDYFFGYLNQTHAHSHFPEYLWRNRERVELPKGTYSQDLFTEEALGFIRRERARPFFLYLAYTLPHANNELTRRTGNGMEVPSDAPYTNEHWPQQQKNYAAMVTRMDADIGRLMALLKELGLDDDTVVLFSSDNGPQGRDEGGFDPDFFQSHGPFRGIKRALYEGGVRVPLVARWPGRIKAGEVSRVAWANYDLLPTLAALAGARAPRDIDGVSMLSALLGRGQRREREHLYWEFHEGEFAQAVRLGRWKAVRKGFDKRVELYDLDADTGETRDVAAGHPRVVRRVERIMKSERTESEFWPVQGGPAVPGSNAEARGNR
ncbi:MAG TPA: arylsulfatase [Pyrinomonadaceae bacterium]|nr:arylsulfatase [Pyrinomonadaceae bacterium]